MKKIHPEKSSNHYHDTFYHDKLSQHGIFSAQAVGWTDFLQYRLFENISQILQGTNKSKTYTMLDVGSGLGDYVQYLKNEKYTNIKYTGIDKIQKMVKSARTKYPGYTFEHGDILHPGFTRTSDFIISSGSLNIMLFQNPDDHFNLVKAFIAKMYALCNYACSFNLLSIHGKDFFPGNDRFYYADNYAVETVCRHMCPDVEIVNEKHDFVFTIHLFKKRLHKKIIM